MTLSSFIQCNYRTLHTTRHKGVKRKEKIPLFHMEVRQSNVMVFVVYLIVNTGSPVGREKESCKNSDKIYNPPCTGKFAGIPTETKYRRLVLRFNILSLLKKIEIYLV